MRPNIFGEIFLRAFLAEPRKSRKIFYPKYLAANHLHFLFILQPKRFFGAKRFCANFFRRKPFVISLYVAARKYRKKVFAKKSFAANPLYILCILQPKNPCAKKCFNLNPCCRKYFVFLCKKCFRCSMPAAIGDP